VGTLNCPQDGISRARSGRAPPSWGQTQVADGRARVAGEDTDEFEVLDLPTRLGDKSLVMPERIRRRLDPLRDAGDGAPVAQDSSTSRREADETRMRHLAFYLALAEEASLKLHTPEQGAWLSRIDRERENLLSTLRGATVGGGSGVGLRLVTAIQAVLGPSRSVELGLRVTVAAIAQTGAQARTFPGGGAHCRGQTRLLDGPLLRGASVSEEASRSPGRSGTRAEPRWCSGTRGGISGAGESSQAREHLGESLALARELGTSPSSRSRSSCLRSSNARKEIWMRRSRSTLMAWRSFASLEIAATSPLVSSTSRCVARTRSEVSRGRVAARGAHDRGGDRLEASRTRRNGWLRGACRFIGEWERAARSMVRRPYSREQTGLHRDPRRAIRGAADDAGARGAGRGRARPRPNAAAGV